MGKGGRDGAKATQGGAVGRSNTKGDSMAQSLHRGAVLLDIENESEPIDFFGHLDPTY